MGDLSTRNKRQMQKIEPTGKEYYKKQAYPSTSYSNLPPLTTAIAIFLLSPNNSLPSIHNSQAAILPVPTSAYD